MDIQFHVKYIWKPAFLKSAMGVINNDRAHSLTSYAFLSPGYKWHKGLFDLYYGKLDEETLKNLPAVSYFEKYYK